MEFFFRQVCLRLALEVQYLVDRFGIHQTTVSRTFNPLSAKPSFQLWYPGGQRLKVIFLS